jgi:hypothetical protein
LALLGSVVVAAFVVVVVAYVAVSTPPASLSEQSDRADLASKLLTSIAIIAGGAWALFRLLLFRESIPNLQMSVTYQSIPYEGETRIAVVDVLLKNAGKVMISAGGRGCRLSVWELPTGVEVGQAIDLDGGDRLIDDIDLLGGYDPTLGYEILPGAEYRESGNVVVRRGTLLGIKVTFHFGGEDEDAISEYALARID